jgi:hypothetical protein
MGINTVVFILNDLWNEYVDHPEKLVREIQEGMSRHRNDQQDLDGVRGVWCFHASSRALILVGGNMAVMLARVGEHPKKSETELEIELLKEAADHYGYKLIRKSKKVVRKDGRYEEGDRVRTTKDNGRNSDWVEGSRSKCQWGLKGIILEVHDAHGLNYEVRHHNGAVAYYDHDELELVNPKEVG